MSYIDEKREPLTIGKLILYVVCGVIFGLFFLWNVFACAAPFILVAQHAQ